MLFFPKRGKGRVSFVLSTSSFSNRNVAGVRKVRFVEGRRLGLDPRR